MTALLPSAAVHGLFHIAIVAYSVMNARKTRLLAAKVTGMLPSTFECRPG